MKFILVLLTLLAIPAYADDGIISKPSKYPVMETISRFEAAVRAKEGAGFIVFTESTTPPRKRNSVSTCALAP